MRYLFFLTALCVSLLFSNDYFEAIEIGGKGIKAYILEQNDQHQTHIVARNSINTAPQSGIDVKNNLSASMIEAIAKDTQTLLNAFPAVYQIPLEHRFIVASSAINKIKNKEALEKRLLETTRINLVFINEEEESLYGFYGSVPPSKWQSSVLMDIGGGNTKIAWLDESQTFRFHEIPLGTVSLTTLAEQSKQPKNTSFRDRCLSVIAPYEPELQSIPSKESLYVIGGIFWVSAYYKYDGELASFVPLSLQDFETMITTYLQPKTQECTPASSEKRCFLLRYYGAKNLVAGAVLAKQSVQRFTDSQILFAKDGTWMLGWFLHTHP